MQIPNNVIQPRSFSEQINLSQAVAGNRGVSGVNKSQLSQVNDAISRSIIEGEVTAKEQSPMVSTELTHSLKSQLDNLMQPSHEQSALGYDEQPAVNRGAIAQYLSTQHSAKRDEVQQLVGIDIYA
ncbi:hypothetical protein ACFOD0_00680 [Shewanella intestini]|uniref:Uncharacterized protein n=1 Tax=Shewanella intestini TaxID=2017544 RepID=A0ABS5HZJ6_9GAMM|nr:MULTISPECIES: hypothetical protein [Shewanella]MBR9727086.1 hypothetical protein [Shewanella intestini]MRG35888.1 hypothetical protein [Shewanella sp. XMDDZSB0408]